MGEGTHSKWGMIGERVCVVENLKVRYCEFSQSIASKRLSPFTISLPELDL